MAGENAIHQLMEVMAKLRSPEGCPWDREQNHMSLRFHGVEEVYELIDAIEAGDDHEMAEELGDLLLQVVFHCQLARERDAFDFEQVCRRLVEKLIRRHPHVFGEGRADTVDAVWAQWERIKRAEKSGTRNERRSALDGIPRHLPALQYAEKLIKKSRKSGLGGDGEADLSEGRSTPEGIGEAIWNLVELARRHGWSAEDLLRREIRRQETRLRRGERTRGKSAP